MELLKTVDNDKQFNFLDHQIQHIEDLLDALKDSTQEQFNLYVNKDENRNDFANWVEHVLNSKEVADRLREKHTKHETEQIIEEEISKRKDQKDVVNQHHEEVFLSEPKEKPQVEQKENENQDVQSTSGNDVTEESFKPQSIVDNKSEETNTETSTQTSEEKSGDTLSIENTEEKKEIKHLPELKDDGPESKPEEVKSEVSKPEEVKPEENIKSEDTDKESKQEEVKSEEVKSEVSKPEDAKPEEVKSEENIKSEENNSTEEENKSEIDPENKSSEKENKSESVVTPIENKDPKKVEEKVKPHHFCASYPDCLKGEFMYGLLIGIIIGLIGMKIISVLIG